MFAKIAAARPTVESLYEEKKPATTEVIDFPSYERCCERKNGCAIGLVGNLGLR